MHPGANRSIPELSKSGLPAARHRASPSAVKKLTGPLVSRIRPEQSLPIQISRCDPTRASKLPTA
jgi:hypothetical protein